MTKTELKKLETQKKHEFIAHAYAAVLSCIPEQTIMLRKQLLIRMTHKSYSRYIRFHRYGMDMNIQIFGDGNVCIELTEALHSDHREQLFEYVPDEDKQEAFLAELKELVSGLIPVFADQAVADFHTYMDYVGCEKSVIEAYRLMMDEWNPKRKEPQE